MFFLHTCDKSVSLKTSQVIFLMRPKLQQQWLRTHMFNCLIKPIARDPIDKDI